MSKVSRHRTEICAVLDQKPDLKNVQIAALLGIPVTAVKVTAAQWRRRRVTTTKRERIHALLNDNPRLTDAELSRLTGATVATSQTYRREWQRNTGYRADTDRCPSCEFIFAPDNPKTGEGVCLACWCLAHRVDQRRLFESGAMARLVAAVAQ